MKDGQVGLIEGAVRFEVCLSTAYQEMNGWPSDYCHDITHPSVNTDKGEVINYSVRWDNGHKGDTSFEWKEYTNYNGLVGHKASGAGSYTALNCAKINVENFKEYEYDADVVANGTLTIGERLSTTAEFAATEKPITFQDKSDYFEVSGAVITFKYAGHVHLYIKVANDRIEIYPLYTTPDIGYAVFVDGAWQSGLTSHPTGTNKAQFTVDLASGTHTIYVTLNGDKLTIGGTSDKEKSGIGAGKHEIYINNSDEVWFADYTTVTFAVPKDTGSGKSIYVCGPINSWTPSDSCKLTWTTGNVWTGEIDLPIGEKFKVVIAATDNPTKIDEYEGGSDRTVVADMSVTNWQ